MMDQIPKWLWYWLAILASVLLLFVIIGVLLVVYGSHIEGQPVSYQQEGAKIKQVGYFFLFFGVPVVVLAGVLAGVLAVKQNQDLGT